MAATKTPQPQYDVWIGDTVHVLSSRTRTDGLQDVQELEGVVTLVTPHRFEYRTARVIRSENVLHPVTEGGFTRTMSLDTLRRVGLLSISR